MVLYSEEEEAGLGPRGLVEGLATTLGTSETRIVYIYIYIFIFHLVHRGVAASASGYFFFSSA